MTILETKNKQFQLKPYPYFINTTSEMSIASRIWIVLEQTSLLLEYNKRMM
jgi:hypothetical protein